MSIKTILLCIRESEISEQLFETAACAAIRFEAHLDVLHVRPNPESFLPYATLGLSDTMRGSITESAERSASEQSERLRQLFEAVCARRKLPTRPRGDSPGSPDAWWREEMGVRNEIIARQGRLADLIIVPRPYRVSPPPSSFEAAVRESGRPVLMVPREAVNEVAARGAAICWNASKEAAHAMAAALPILRTIGAVHILSSEKRMKQSPNADDVSNYLKCHGIEAKPHVFHAKGRCVGETLLGEAKSLGCDLLVVGGYSRPRLRELVMGGVTRHLMEHADIPIFMMH
jgi:nucleotide-binding universal stress UspA family protein